MRYQDWLFWDFKKCFRSSVKREGVMEVWGGWMKAISGWFRAQEDFQ